jgi:hypothetical protein
MTGKDKEITLEELLTQNMEVDDTFKVPEEQEENKSSKPTETPEEELSVEDALQRIISGEDDDKEIDKEPEQDKSQEKDTSKAPDSSKKHTEESETPFTLAFARYQLEQGNLRALDEEELLNIIKEQGEEAAMSHLQNKETEAIRNELLESYEDDVKYYLDLVDSGVDRDLAKNYAQAKTRYDSISKEDLEDEDKEDLRKEVLKTHYKLTTSFSDAKIDKLIERAVSLGEDIEESLEAIDGVKKYFTEVGEQEKQKIKNAELKQKEEAAKSLKELDDKIDALTEIIPKMPLNKVEKNKIKELITKPVKNVNGVNLNAIWAKRMEDPFKFETTLAALYHYGVFDGKWDKIISGTKSKAVGDLKKAIETNTSFKTNTPAYREEKTAVDSIDSMRRAFGF